MIDFNKNYTLNDLLTDESFLNYYFKKNEDDWLNWHDWQDDDDARAKIVEQAFSLLDRLSLKWQTADIDLRYKKIREELFEQALNKADSDETTEIKAIQETSKLEKTGTIGYLKVRHRWFYAAAASVVLAVSAWFFYDKVPFFRFNNDAKLVESQPITPSVSGTNGQASKLILTTPTIKKAEKIRFFRLPDGTRVQLAEDSRLTLAKDFGKTERVVFLSGQAQFDVAHDKARPFRVNTEGVTTTALGTVFIVQSATVKQAGKVILLQGKVQVSYQNQTKSTILNEGEAIDFTANKTQPFSPIEKIDFEKINTWHKQAVLSIEKVRLADVFNRLAQSYAVQFEGFDAALGNEIITGIFDTKLPLKDLLDVLSFANDFDYDIKDKTVRIKGALKD